MTPSLAHNGVLSPEQFDDLMLDPETMDKLDELECSIEKLTPVEFPLWHLFTPGLYTRTIQMPAGAILTSKIHKTEHPFVISQGRVSVWDAVNGSTVLSAPHIGVTAPGTRRVLYIHEDTIWSTFHVTKETDVDRIESQIILQRVNPRLKGTRECLLQP